MADLEDHLGARLPHRTTRRLVVTEAGAEYLKRVQDVLERIAEEVPTFDGAPRSWRFEDGAGQAVLELKPPPVLTAQHVDTPHAAALAGLGVTGLPSFMAEDTLREHALERVLTGWTLQTIHAALPTRRYLPARTRVFLDLLVDQFGGADADPWLDAAGCATAAAA